jgi:hypothetical protein
MLVLQCVLFSQSTPASSSGTAKVYFIRKSGFYAGLVRSRLFIDSVRVCKYGTRKFSVHDLPAGKHTVDATSKNKSNKTLEINLEAGKTYYFRIRSKYIKYGNPFYIEPISEEKANQLLKRVKPACK